MLGGLPLAAQPLSWTSPRQTALAGLAAPLADGLAPLLSPAAMGEMDVPEASLAAGRLFGLAGLPVMAAGIAGPIYDAHKAGLGVVRLGSGALTQTFVAGAYAYKLDRTSLAIQGGYYQLALGDGPTVGVPTLSLAGQTRLIPRLILAGQVLNITQPILKPETGERLPATLRATAMLEAGPDLLLLVQTDKTLGRQPGLSAGAEYRVHRYVRLRAGAAPLPGWVGAGLRVDVWGMVLEYGLAHNGLLGEVHSLGVGWAYRPKPKLRTETESSH